MTLSEWLEQAGRVSALAAHCEVTPSAVSQWQHNGVPLRHMAAVSAFTGGEVTTEELARAAMEAATAREVKRAAEKAAV